MDFPSNHLIADVFQTLIWIVTVVAVGWRGHTYICDNFIDKDTLELELGRKDCEIEALHTRIEDLQREIDRHILLK